MASYEHSTTVFTNGDDGLLGAVAVQRFHWAGAAFVLVGGTASGELTLYREDGASLVEVDQISIGSVQGMTAFAGFEIVTMSDGQSQILVLGEGGDDFNLLDVSATGFGQSDGFDIQNGGNINNAIPVYQNDVSYLIHDGSLGSGLVITEYDETGEVGSVVIADTDDLPLGDISVLTHIDVGGTGFVFAASAFDTGLAVFEISTDGGLIHKDTVLPSDGSGFWLPQASASLEVGGNAYLLLGSAGTDSVTSYSISSEGVLFETDHIIDSLDTRFEAVTTLEAFTYQDFGYVIAAGNDDGFTLLELSSDGQLDPVLTLEDSFDWALNNVSDISADLDGDLLTVLVASEGDNGVSQFEIDMASVQHDPRDWASLNYPSDDGLDAQNFMVDEFLF